ncbi:hypothetical protein [Dictyobacter aurantiacus]|nr:hypothetical protein [Dictyobacter aurantiacus]
MTWMLAAFIKEYEQNRTSPVWQALVKEICTSFEQNLKESKIREEYVDDLLQHVLGSNKNSNNSSLTPIPIQANNKSKS